MDRKSTAWKIRRGDPSRIGTTKTADGYQFAVQVSGNEKTELWFYKKGGSEPVQKLSLPESCRTGNVYAVIVLRQDLSFYEYEYRQGGQPLADAGARIVVPSEEAVRYRVLKGLEVTPAAAWIPYEEMVLYKVHVRGYTMQSQSRVHRRGTFGGLQEKIPYWKELGVTSLELMPAYEFAERPKEERPFQTGGCLQQVQKNYWGYTEGNYFAPKAAYCGSQPEREVKEFVSALHEAGMECLMDFYFPRETAPSLVLEVLRFWRIEYQIDGFVLLGDGVWMELLARDMVLADAKLLGPGSDMGRIAGLTGESRRRLAEYHAGFQDTMRRFLRGDDGQIPDFLYYSRQNPSAWGVVHYLANHDGFTLADLVSYNERHNEANGENNRDGSSYNFSYNCGVEGATRRPSIRKLRARQMRNAVLLLMLSQGTPLIYGGDEFGNSQGGNNNAYCQDNETGWTDWSQAKKYAGFTSFVRDVISFRKSHPILHMPYELRPTDYKALGWPEISYHSEKAWFSNTETDSREAGILYCGGYAVRPNQTADTTIDSIADSNTDSTADSNVGSTTDSNAGSTADSNMGSNTGSRQDQSADDFIYVIYNLSWDKKEAALPDLPGTMRWYLAVNSAEDPEQAVRFPGHETVIPEKKSLTVDGRTILVLIGK